MDAVQPVGLFTKRVYLFTLRAIYEKVRVILVIHLHDTERVLYIIKARLGS